MLLACGSLPVVAEGTRDYMPSGYSGGRAGMGVLNGNNYGGVARDRQFNYVYAEAGEYILLGSSAMASGGDIRVFNPQNFGARGNETVPATANFSCLAATPPTGSYSGSTRGRITSRIIELAGPNSADNTATVTNGFAPCAYLAPQSGIYGVVFTGAPSGTTGVPGDAVGTVTTGLRDAVQAWDITVRPNAASLADLRGRVFTYTWTTYVTALIRPTIYYITEDGYRYRMEMRGLNPGGAAFYANRSGFLDNGQPLYKDIRGTNQPVSAGFPTGVVSQAPQFPIFFNDVGPAGANATQVAKTLAVLGIPLVPTIPQLNTPSFAGTINGSTSSQGSGGTFQFTTANTLTYEIVVSRGTVAPGADVNYPTGCVGNFDPANVCNRVLTGTALTGTHQILWDGSDNNGFPFPGTAGGASYAYRVVGRNGEIHFPIIDLEGNATGGPTLTKLNGSQDSIVYYDDRGYRTRNGQLIGQLNGHLCGPTNVQSQPTPNYSLLGVDSTVTDSASPARYYRYWPGSNDPNTDCSSATNVYFGSAKALDLWALERTPIFTGAVSVVPLGVLPDVNTQVSVTATAFPGDIVYGSMVFGNVGGVLATGVGYTAVIGTPGNCPTGFSFTAVPSGVTSTYNATTCAVTFVGMPTTLVPSQSLSFNFQYIAPATGPIPVNTTITSTEDPLATSPAPNRPSPNRDSGQTLIVISDVATGVTVPSAIVTAGTTVSGNVVFGNLASATATAQNVTYGLTIGTPGNCPTNVAIPSLPSGVTFTYNATSCVVAFSGLPTSLAPGTSYSLDFTYTAPSNGSVPVSSVISTSTTQASTANDVANGVTPVRQLSTDLSIVKSNAGSTYTPGGTGSYTLTVRNGGPDNAIGVAVDDTLPAGINLNGAVTCTVSGGGSCGPNTGTAPMINLLLNLNVGAVVTITIPVLYASTP